jgi:tetratricopeptide (TPR) repeat protein
MFNQFKKIESLVVAIAGIFTIAPVGATSVSLPVRSAELPVISFPVASESLNAVMVIAPDQLPITNKADHSDVTGFEIETILVQNPAANEVFQQGVNLAKQQNMEGAEAAFRRAIQMDPNFAEAYANLGSILANQNKLAESLPNFENAIRLKPNSPEFHYMLGQVLYAQNKMADAVESVKKARDLFRKQGKTQEANTLEQVLKDMGSR